MKTRSQEYSIDTVLVEAIAKGFRDDELYKVRRAYWEAFVHYEATAERPLPGLKPALEFLNTQRLTAYSAARQYIAKAIDGWHAQADGNR